MFNKSYSFFSCCITLLLLTASCDDSGSDNNMTGGNDSNFNRSEMLQNQGNNIIVPSYNELQLEVDNLQAEVNTFVESPTVENLATVQTSLKNARMAWQYANMFQFGPAESVALRGFVNIFPADTAKIESNIETGEFTLGTSENQAAAGFPTMGYLLHGVGETPEEIVAKYTSDADAEGRKSYLQENINFIKTNVDNVVNEWSSNGGDFIGTFLSEENAGVDVGSSLGLMFNATLVHYERFIRNAKIGIPAGVESANTPRPGNVEAFYGGYSVELARKNLEAVENLFLGRTMSGTDGIGLEENLEALGAVQLSNDIKTQFDEALTALDALQDPLSQQIETNNEPVITAFTELQDLVPLIKADMASRLGITITFQDNDGD